MRFMYTSVVALNSVRTLVGTHDNGRVLRVVAGHVALAIGIPISSEKRCYLARRISR